MDSDLNRPEDQPDDPASGADDVIEDDEARPPSEPDPGRTPAPPD